MRIPQFQDRIIFLLIAIFCASLIVSALVLQYFKGVSPCPLCIVQRLFYLLAGLSALAAYFGWIKSVGTRRYGWLVFVFALLGGAVAVRQVWLQHFPPVGDPTKCLVPGGTFFNTVISALGGVGSCAVRDFTFLGLSLAEWSSICFFLIGAVSLGLIFGFFQVDESSERGEASEHY